MRHPPALNHPCAHAPCPPAPCRHGIVRVEECEDDLYAAVDLVADKLKRKLVKASARCRFCFFFFWRGGGA